MSTDIDVLCLITVLGVVTKKITPTLSHITVISYSMVTPRNSSKYLMNRISAQTLLTATYSASVDDNITLF